MTEINFLSSRTRHKQKQREQDKRLFKIASLVLAVVVFVFVLIMGLKLVVNLKIQNKTKEIANLKKTITELAPVELSYLIFVNKLRAVGEIYAARSDKQTAMNYFADLMSNVATITGMNYDEESGGLNLQLDHQNIFSVEDSMNILNSPLVTDVYRNVEKSSLSRQDQGNYLLRLAIQLKTVEDLGLLDTTPANNSGEEELLIEDDFATEPMIEESN